MTILLIIIFGLKLIDGLTTYRGMKKNLIFERNFILRWLIDRFCLDEFIEYKNEWIVILYGILTGLMLCWAVYTIDNYCIGYITIGFYCKVIVDNLRR